MAQLPFSSSYDVTIATIILMSMSLECVLGCFPMQTIFERSTLWYQDLRNPWQRLYVIGQISDDVMSIETQQPERITKAFVTCLHKVSDHRYLVKVEEGGVFQGFQCLQFKPLTKQVVRKGHTQLRPLQVEVNCKMDAYTEEEEVMIAYHSMIPEACPLTGGYQMIFHENENIQAHCLDSVQTYNPRLEFACESNHVIADFGPDCAPIIPIQTQTIYRSPFAYLECVDSWDVPGGVKVILLRKKSDVFSYWCMHYKPIKGSDGELLSIHLSFNGKCPQDVFDKKWQPTDVFNAFGILAKFVPNSDKRCSDANYIRQCQSRELKCFESKECPLNCQRCNRGIVRGQCDLSSVTGQWSRFRAFHELKLEVKSQSLQIKDYGSFVCSNSTKSSLKDVYLVVQDYSVSTCLPFHVCVKLSSPSAGVLNFFMLAAKRGENSSQVLSCSQALQFPVYSISYIETEVVTLLNTQRLPSVPCDIPENMTFPSGLEICFLALRQCSGSCTTLYIDYDKATCGNGNNTYFDLDHEHVCRARLQFSNGFKGIITSFANRESFLCWIYNDQQLYITSSDSCNPGGADLVVTHPERLSRYGPLWLITSSQSSSNDSNNGASCKLFVDIVTIIIMTILSPFIVMFVRE